MANAGSVNCTSTTVVYPLATDEPVMGPLRVKAAPGNTGHIRVGGGDILSTAYGFTLAKSEFVDLEFVRNVADVHAMAATANDDVEWIKLQWDV